MKIAHVGLMVNGRDEGLSYELRRAATQYAEFPLHRNTANDLANLTWIPDIIFFQIHSPHIDGIDVVEMFSGIVSKFREEGTRVINWNGDIRNTFPTWMAHFPADVTAFANMRDVREIPRNGKYLQIGIDPQVFKKWGETSNNDVVFMGNDYGSQFPLGQLRRELVTTLQRIGGKVYGNYSGAVESIQADPKDPFPNQSRESKIYSEAAIAISMSHYTVERYTSDRLFRCMGSHCFTLAHHYPGIEEDFEIGVHLDTFNTLPEMEEKIRYWLEHPEEREKIAKAGYEHVHENFDYRSMVGRILEL